MADVDRPKRLADTLDTVLAALAAMGIEDATEDRVLAAPAFYDAPVLLSQPGQFGQFSVRMAVNLRFVGYSFEEVAFLTVRQFCETYVRDSFPALPERALSDDQYDIEAGRGSSALVGGRKEIPICFVLGPPRSGTTLLRAMLNTHSQLWAPGELHLANFGTMADRAEGVGPILRYMPIPELASRCGESIAHFSNRFRSWELEHMPVADAYQHLHDADPDAMIVDKSPPYSAQRAVLERIGETFPRAKFIHLLRSPHDVIRSYVRMQFHRGNRRLFEPGRNPYQMGEAIWFSCNDNAEKFLARIPNERKCTVRYEELTASPAEPLRRVCELLERDFEADMANPYAAPGATVMGAGDLHVNLLDKVEHRTPIDAFYPLGNRCRALAERYGY
jgi:hypothetical protein